MRTLSIAAAALVGLALLGCDDKSRIIVVHADSLSGPFNEVKKVFEAEHPGVRVDLEPFGSVLACRKLQAGVPCDVIALADRHLFDELLAPQKLTSWNIGFATTEIVIIKSSKSRYNTEINSENWFEVLTRPDVKVGVADATLDPCGYWTRMVWILADLQRGPGSGVRGQAEGAGARGQGSGNAGAPARNRPSPPVALPSTGEGGKLTPDPSPLTPIYDRMMAKCTAEYTRPDSQQLISLVEGAGGWDYAFVYKAQAEQQRLSYVSLPAEINLGSVEPEHVKGYAAAKVTVAETGLARTGEPLVFGLSIPNSARQPAEAEAFIAFVLSDRGRVICRQAGMPMLDKPFSSQKSLLPKALQEQVTSEK